MKSYLIETSVIIDYIKGKEHARTLIRSLNGTLTSSNFCLAELYEGVMRVREREVHKQVVLNYFDSLKKVYGLDSDIATKFGELRADLKQKGNIIEDVDLFIAATCVVYDLTLVTFNYKHFARVPGLKLYEKKEATN